jgi:Leucine-rich repeat (LRR) protein
MSRSITGPLSVLLTGTMHALTPMPDPALRAWANLEFPGCIVGTSIDENHPGVAGATALWIGSPGIQDLTGLSAFANVTLLQLSGLNLGSVDDLPPQLTDLAINGCQFTSIIDSPTLTYLGIQHNNLTTVQLGYYPALNTLSCFNNQLTTLDVSSCPSLGYLNCSNNQLTSITGYGAYLWTLYADHNQLSSLSVPNYCGLLDISHNQFTALPTMNTNVQRVVSAHHNQISTFTWGGGNQLSTLDLSHNQLTSTPDLSVAALRSLNLGNNPLTALTTVPLRLEELWVDSTLITCLPYLKRHLEELYAQGTALTCIPNQPPGLVMSAANFGFTPAVCGPADPCYIAPPAIAMKVFLQGPYDPNTFLMKDDLRTLGLLPTTEPYTAMGFTYSGQGWSDVFDPALLAVTGNDAIVDWVVVDMLPDPLQSSQGNAVRYSRPALLQRDGDVVGLDGSWPVVLNMNQGKYVAAVRHRNHLGAVEKFATGYTDTTVVKDFTEWTAMACWPGAMHGDSLTDPNRQLWCGDVDFDHTIRYAGAANDRDVVLQAIGGTVPTAVVNNVYSAADVNMDGVVKYAGTRNDRDLILRNVGGSTPTAVRYQIGFQ